MAISAGVVIGAGSLLHFAWAWSGQRPWVAIFAATNESTWEHLKLGFWPALALAPIQRLLYGACPGWLPAIAIRCVLPSLLIVVLFHGYTALLGTHHLVADIGIFAVAIVVGEFLGDAALSRDYGPMPRLGAAAVLALAVMLFSTLSFSPPGGFLFDAPSLNGAAKAERSTIL